MHDSLCLYYGERNEGDCTMCGVIATTRVHERNRIARILEVYDFLEGDQAANIVRNSNV